MTTPYTLSVSSSGSAGHWGDIALVFSGSQGTGASVSGTGSGAPSLTITTTADNSAIAVLILDANAVSGASRTWLTVNSITPTAANGYELGYTLDGITYGVYVAYYPNAGPAGPKTVGMSAPAGMEYSAVAVEALGSPGASGSETGTGTDAAFITATITAADTGTGTDTAEGGLRVPAADTGSGTESASEAAAPVKSGADTGTGTDAASFTLGAKVADTGTASDVGTVLAHITYVSTDVYEDTYTDQYPAGTTEPITDGATGSDQAFISAGPSFPQIPLGLNVEILINGTWTDITSYVYARSDVEITRGRPDETQQVQPAHATMVLNNQDGRFSPSNPGGAYAPYLTRNVQLRVYVSASAASGELPVQYQGYRFWGEIASVEQHWDPSGTDKWVNLTASGPLRRYSQGDATIGSAMKRYYTRLTGSQVPYGYWPAEDASGAEEIASALSGVAAMGYTGTPSFSSDSSFGGSDAFPSIGGSAWHGETQAAETPPGTGSLTETTAGTYAWTCPPGVTEVTGVVCIGGGGGGGSWGDTKGGGGGGGGGLGQAPSVAVTPGVTYSFTVGAGGSPGGSPGANGTNGSDSFFPGDTETVRGYGAGGGAGGDNSAGGGNGDPGLPSGSFGGAGGAGQASATVPMNLVLTGNGGATGTGSGGTADQQTYDWTVPPEVASVNVTAAGSGGGGEGGGAFTEGYGGGGGGGGGKFSGSILVTAGSSYTMSAANGGNGGASGQPGEAGTSSGVTGDSGTNVISNGGGGGSGGGGGGAGGGDTGSAGGAGARAVTGEGMGGGGGGGGGGGSAGQSAGANAGAGGNPREPGGPGGNGSGGGWGAVSNGGSGATNGGGGATNNLTAGGGGGGGGGAVTNTSGNAGGGGGAGWVYWTWEQPGVPAGGGGGSSAGTSGQGNDGSDIGVGGTAVTGGGAGGSQGLAGQNPGGGGGGGVPDTGNLGAGTVNPGPGAPGQVSFAWSGGAVSPVAADIVRFALDVTSTGGTQTSYSFTATDASPAVFTAAGSTYAAGTPVQLVGTSLPTGFTATPVYYVVNPSTDTFELAATAGGTAINSTSSGSGSVQSTLGWVIARILTYGTVARMDLTYYTGGSFDLTGYASSGAVLFDSGRVSFGLDGVPVYVDVQLVASGSNATWHINTVQPGQNDQEGLSGTVNGVTVGYVSDVYISPNSDVTFASAGQISVQSYADTIADLAQVVAGYNGELAANRLARLAAEENLAFELTGNSTDTPQMGPQQDDTYVNVLQSCEDMDQGQLYEPRDMFGIAYRTRISMQGQSPVLTLDYTQQHLAPELVPIADDQFTRNYITVTRNNGSNTTAVLTSGAMSTAVPPNGVGTYVYTLTVYGFSDAQLAPLTAWMLSTGTVADLRYPVLTIDMTRPEIASLFTAVASIAIGDYTQVVNVPSWLTSGPIQQLAWGAKESINAFKWTLSLNCVPEGPYSTGNPPSW